METYVVKSFHHWFNENVTVKLTYENCNKVIYINDIKFDPTNPDDIRTMYMFTGTREDDLYDVQDEDEIMKIRYELDKRHEKIYKQIKSKEEQKKQWEILHKEEQELLHEYIDKSKKIRKWIYDYQIKPGIKMIVKSCCGCNMGHCGAILSVDLDDQIYTRFGDLCASFTGMNIPCYAICGNENGTNDEEKYEGEKDEDEYYEHPDSVLLYLDKYDKNSTFKVYEKGCYHEAKESKIKMSDDDGQYTIMSWNYGR